MDVESHRAWVLGMSHLYKSGQFSDLTLRFHDVNATTPREIKVHQVVLCTQSSFFSKACRDGFTEAETHVITLHDDSSDDIDRMLEYLYEHDYNDHQNNTINARTYAIADKYGILDLKNLAKQRFEDNFKPLHARATLSHISKTVRTALPDLLRVVYLTTPDNDQGLRDILVRVLEPHLDELMAISEFVVAAKEAGYFAHDVLVMRHREGTVRCDYCFTTLRPHTKRVCTECRDEYAIIPV